MRGLPSSRTNKAVRSASGKGRISLADRRFAQQFGNHALVHVGVLPKIHDGEMKAEALNRFAQIGEPSLPPNRCCRCEPASSR